jgi:indolepyruvate ferredoxin oxidoreductase alpha subunit
MSGWASGAAALAHAAIDAGVTLVTGYPGVPATPVVNAIIELTSPDEVQVEWCSNEKVALETAFGASVGGARSLFCAKGVGLNVALDPLMVINLSGCNAGLVLLVGDDPGSWGSQNEQDSRPLGQAAQIPVMEPTSVADAYHAVVEAFCLSEDLSLPVMVRFTRSLAVAQGELPPPLVQMRPAPVYRRKEMRWVVLPINAIPLHRQLQEKLSVVRARFEELPLNGIDVADPPASGGIIAAGFLYQKMLDLWHGAPPSGIDILHLGTFYPLPERLITAFLSHVDRVLILEETGPWVERAVAELAQRAGLFLPILGRQSGHVPVAGELFQPDIAQALTALWPRIAPSVVGPTGRPRPSREPLCDGCPYRPTADVLAAVMAEHGGREKFVVVGEPGCMVRTQLPPYKLLDVKNSLGASVAMAAGLALSPIEERVIALCGDSAFLHSGLAGLLSAVTAGAQMLLLILDNGTTALSGGQSHPASKTDARGHPRRGVDIEAITRGTGVRDVSVVDLDRGESLRPPLETALQSGGLSVIIVRGECPRWSATSSPVQYPIQPAAH